MTTHTCSKAVSSTWFSPVAGDEGRAFIPSSIPPGTSVTLEGFLRVLIRQPDEVPPAGTLFAKTDTLSLTASMPWLSRTLPNFDFNRTVKMQFPIELQNIEFAPNLSRGSTSNIAWQVREFVGYCLYESNLMYLTLTNP